jgi:tRNA G10  N-methylase Trm11
VRFSKALELRNLVTFFPNKKEPIHNWYYFKEEFSKKLVDIFIDKFNLDKNSLVLDPFCGIGTTLLACKQRGIKSIGFDVSPFFVFVSNVKTRDYDLDKLKEAISYAFKWKFERPEKISKEKFIRKVFSKYTLEDTIFYKNKILEIEDKRIRNFLLLALIDSSIKASWITKDGAVIKREKRGKPPLKMFFKNKVKKMFKDLKKADIKPTSVLVEVGDARKLNLEDNSIDAVITSPPYLNKIEYTKIYNIENYLFDFPEIKSHIGSSTEDASDLDENLPLSAKIYFKDIDLALNKMYRVCKDNAKLAIVIGGGCYPDRIVETDRIAAELAEKIGFKVKNILVARESWCTKARTVKVGKIRESIILLEK